MSDYENTDDQREEMKVKALKRSYPISYLQNGMIDLNSEIKVQYARHFLIDTGDRAIF
jgi:hypothetical protein